MTRARKRIIVAAVIGIVLILSWGGVQLWLWQSPLVVISGDRPVGELFDSRTAVGRVFDDVQACGQQQKNLYGCIVAFKDKHGRVPKDMNELINDVHEAMSFRNCLVGLSPYVVHFENFGNPHAVLIEERQNKHRTALKLWLRGIKPRVQTFGDATKK
ncbi:MAG: hypothetical protein JW741_13855 [Sedimentisphaerales bacterium]|nr:hypothetical protein [Sedimentisphaerales bacterium]